MIWSEAYEAEGAVNLSVSDDYVGFDHRVIAVDSQGRDRQAQDHSSFSAGKIRQTAAKFGNLRLSEIKEFKFQTRPYEWVEFKNVSLKPGAKTDVQVLVPSQAASGDVPAPDLAIADDGFQVLFDREQELWFAIVSVKNEGETVSPQFDVHFVDWEARAGGRLIGGVGHSAAPLEPGSAWNVESERFVLAEGVREIVVLIDPNNKVVESDEANNHASRRCLVSDGRPVKFLHPRYGKAADVEVEVVDKKKREERVAQERAKIAEKLAALENHRMRLQRELDIAERSLEDVRVRWGISDLEERSYPHPMTSRLSRLQEERDNCIVEASRLEARIEILDKKVKAADAEQKAHGFKVSLEKARDELILLRSKLEQLEQMVREAEAEKKELDSARAQYRQRLAVRDERRKMLDSINEQIEKLRIMYDDPHATAVPVTVAEPDIGSPGRLNREEIRAKLMNLENRRLNIQRELDVAEMAMAEVRQRWGFGDLEERSYPHPVTARLMRLEQERDACLVEIAQLRAEVNNLEEQAETADGKANLQKAQDKLQVLMSKLEELQKMCDEAVAKEKDLDTARKRMLDSLKEQIEKLRILHDDPATPEVRE
jgi:hypothetical protein